MSYPVLTPLDLNGNEIQNVSVQKLGTDPASPFEGQVWENTTSHELKAYLNGSVVIVQTGLITSADIQDGTITDTDVAAANKDGSAGTASMRTIGTGATQAMAGNTRLDTIASPTGSVSLNSQKITGLADGTNPQDAATVSQLNAAIAGLDVKGSVKAASTANLTLSGTQTVDGVALIAGDRILVKDQSTASQNGIYVVGSGSWTRATDFDAWAEIPGALVAVEQGTANSDKAWLSTADQGGTLGSTNITFTAFGQSAAGTTKYAANITGDASTTQFTVTHNLSTTDVLVQVFDVTNDLEVIVDKKRPTANTCRIDFATAPASGKVYRVVVVG